MKLSITLTSIIFLNLFFASNVYSFCMCELPDDPDANPSVLHRQKKSLNELVKDGFEKSDLIFLAKVIEIKLVDGHYFTKLKIGKIWKGEFLKEVVIKSSILRGGNCEYHFTEGKEYVVYSYKENNEIQASICNRTALVKNNKDLKTLDKLKILWESKKPIKSYN